MHHDYCLIIIDYQRAYLPEPYGVQHILTQNYSNLLKNINKLTDFYKTKNIPIIFTRKWLTNDHITFYTFYNNAKKFDKRIINNRLSYVWPEHCIKYSPSAYIPAHLDTSMGKCILNIN